MDSNPQISRQILQKAFPGMADNETDMLIANGKVMDYPLDTVLCREGEIEHKFYIILEGQVRVSKKFTAAEDRFLKNLEAGDFFGEMGIIHNAPRAATITTTKPTKVLEVYKEGFENALQQSASLSLAMVREVSRRLRENDEMAIEDLRLKAGELAGAYQQLAEQELVRSEFLTTIAHELRTPLTSASGFLQVVTMGMMQGEALQTALKTVARNVQQIVSLVNDILFLQEMDLILSDFEPIDVGAVVASIVEQERGAAEKSSVGFNMNIVPNLPKVSGDAKSLERAFAAVLNNAVKFSPDGGEVNVVVGFEKGWVQVSIRDQGIGISDEFLPRIYDRFFRLEEFEGNLFGGVGLGLSIAKQVFEQHGGEIKVESEAGKGSEFVIHLKAAGGLSEEKFIG